VNDGLRSRRGTFFSLPWVVLFSSDKGGGKRISRVRAKTETSYLTFSNNWKYRSRLIPAVVILVRMCVTGTLWGLVLITTGRGVPGLVMTMWSPLWRLMVNPSNSKTRISVR
jgi:hypothetical protein